MSAKKRHLNLSVFVQLYGTHGHAWRRTGVEAGGRSSYAKWLSTVMLLERGKFDFAFFADFIGDGGVLAGNGRAPRGGFLEPLTLTAALAAQTKNIGLIATVNTNFNDPYNLARRFATIDHISGGRIGWNVVASLSDNAVKTFGIADPLGRDERYARAGEFIDVAKALWDSWDDDAFDHPDKQTGQFFDPASAHPLHHRGRHFKADALLDIARPVQGHPVLFQAGNSDAGKEFAAQYAELIYAAAQTIEEAKKDYADVKSRLAKYGREPDDLRVTPGLYYFLGRSRQEARENYESFREAVDVTARRNILGVDVSELDLDGPVPDGIPEPANGLGRWKQALALARRENLSIRDLILRFSAVQGHWTVIGTPKDIADQIEEWFVGGAADGFQLKPSLLPEDLENFVDLVIPELQKRGIFRTEYEFETLRENLGFKRPQSQWRDARATAAE